MTPSARAAAVTAAPRRAPAGRYWHQGPTRHPFASCRAISTTSGRYHRAGEPGVWYASSREQAAWAELFRHFVDEGIDPFEVRRTVGSARCDALKVLDLTNPALLEQLGLHEDDLIGDDYEACQEIAAVARDVGFDGVLSPSAALPGQRTLVVFHDAMGKLQQIGPERIRQAPPRVVDLLGIIRLHPEVPTSVRRILWVIRSAGREAVARARRS